MAFLCRFYNTLVFVCVESANWAFEGAGWGYYEGHAPSRAFLIDTFGFIFRAYHARARSGAPPMRTTSGLSTEAVYIFHNMLRKLKATFEPEYLAAVFESKGPTFREKEFEEYKANRPEMPPDLQSRFRTLRNC